MEKRDTNQVGYQGKYTALSIKYTNGVNIL